MSSINTNIGAYSAQQNLRTANAATANSIGKLSSGNRIQRAADDVAGLSVGTILATNVSSLKKGLENAGQANSLLQVADGGLKNITNILQRQKALSVAATSGILSAAERGYLNQEFQNLTAEIDRLVDNTKFNSVKLLDGSLSKAVEVETLANVKTSAGTAATSGTILTVAAGLPANNSKISVNGVEITFTTDTVGSALAAGKVRVGANVTVTAQNIVKFLNNSGDARLAGLVFRNAAGVVTAEWGGGLGNGSIEVTSASVSGTTNVTIPATATTIDTTTNAEDFFGRARVKAIGSVGGSLLAFGDTAATGAGDALVLANATVALDRTTDWIGKFGEGKLGKFELQYTAQDTAVISLEVGNIIYTSAATDLFNATLTSVTLTGRDKDNTTNTIGGTFQLNFKGTATTGFIDNQTEANEIAAQINDAFKDITFVQNRDIKSFQEGAIITDANGVEILQLDGASANFQSHNFDDVKIGGFKITAPEAGSSDAKISVVINGEEYRSFSGIGSKLKTNSIIALQNVNDPLKSLTIQLPTTTLAGQTTTAADISTQDKADIIAAALDAAFGAENGKASLNFQIGSSSTDAIGVEVENAGSVSLFNNQTLDVLTVDNANAASDALDIAIARVTALRANIGALQSRFDFASSNLETSIQNVDAARSTFLDANISEESTLFAQAQVKLQASISVLAQANQLPQNLLKLIG